MERLDADTGETTKELYEVRRVRDSPYSKQVWMDLGRDGFLVEGPNQFRYQFRFPRLTSAGLSVALAVFGSDALCVSEGAGPVRCFDCGTGSERWRCELPEYTGVIQLSYRQGDGCFCGVHMHPIAGPHFLVRFSPEGGRLVRICRLPCRTEAFCLVGDAVVTSNGEVIQVADGKKIKTLRFSKEGVSGLTRIGSACPPKAAGGVGHYGGEEREAHQDNGELALRGDLRLLGPGRSGEIQGDAEVDGGGLIAIHPVVHQEDIVAAAADPVGESARFGRIGYGQNAMGQIVIEALQVVAGHQGDAHFAGAGLHFIGG
jgi:hypothetical protein